jgi:hypothetical protein
VFLLAESHPGRTAISHFGLSALAIAAVLRLVISVIYVAIDRGGHDNGNNIFQYRVSFAEFRYLLTQTRRDKNQQSENASDDSCHLFSLHQYCAAPAPLIPIGS